MIFNSKMFYFFFKFQTNRSKIQLIVFMSQYKNFSNPHEESYKDDNRGQRQQQRKRRRKKQDENGRDYTCACGKSYLSYPALYTHVKTKHNEQSLIAQKLKIPHQPSDLYPTSKQHPQHSKPPKSQKVAQQDQFSIDHLKQFLIRQFIKQKSQQTLLEIKTSLKLKQDQITYINYILSLADNLDLKYEEEDNNKNLFSNCKSEQSGGGQIKEDTHEMVYAFQSSPQFKKYGQINIIKNIIEKNHKQKNLNFQEKKGFIPCLFPIQEFSKRNIKKNEILVDDILGMFLREFLKTGQQNNETINYVMKFFLCQIKQFFTLSMKDKPDSLIIGESLIQKSNQMVQYLTCIQNPFIRQPILICKLLFFLMRWMFRNQLTQKLVKFNQAGSS